jgi:hypothetical protein
MALTAVVLRIIRIRHDKHATEQAKRKVVLMVAKVKQAITADALRLSAAEVEMARISELGGMANLVLDRVASFDWEALAEYASALWPAALGLQGRRTLTHKPCGSPRVGVMLPPCASTICLQK